MKRRIGRRRFLQSAAGLAAAGVAVVGVPGKAFAANSRLQHACIGVGGMMGGGDLGWFLDRAKGGRRGPLRRRCGQPGRRRQRAPGARTYSDWREMLQREGDRIDSVNVTVPDHMHAAISMAALAKGKHVFCQKPMAHDVCEARAMTAAAAKARQGYPVGQPVRLEHRRADGDRNAPPQRDRSGRARGHHGASRRHRMDPAGGTPPGQGLAAAGELNWDLWLGTAPYRPYAPGYHPSAWRGWQDFGTGWSGDIGCHFFNVAYQGLELTAPRTIKAQVQESWVKSPAHRADTWPQSNHITWTFPGTAHTAKELLVEWYDGEFLPPPEILHRIEIPNFRPCESTLFIGSEGVLFWPAAKGRNSGRRRNSAASTVRRSPR